MQLRDDSTQPAPVWLLPRESSDGEELGAHGPSSPLALASPTAFHLPGRGAARAAGSGRSQQQQDEEAGMAGRTLLMVLSGTAGRRRIVQRLQRAGVRLVLYSPHLTWVTAFVPEQDWILGPVDDAQQALARVQAWVQRQPSTKAAIDGVLCVDEFGVQLAAELAHHLGLPFTRPDVIERVRNKYLFREACQRAGVSSPKFTRIGAPLGAEDAGRILGQLGMRFPLVAKPAAGAGSFAVTRVDTWKELEGATRAFFLEVLPRYLANLGLTEDAAPDALKGMVVEEFIHGNEVDIDCVVVRGRLLFASVSDNHPCEGSGTAGPGADGATSAATAASRAFVERGGRCPSNLPAHMQAELLHMASQVVGLWGERLSGVVHLEAFSTPRGPVPIELNARVGGAECYTNVLTAWGVDLGVNAARIALGLPPALPALPALLPAPHPDPPAHIRAPARHHVDGAAATAAAAPPRVVALSEEALKAQEQHFLLAALRLPEGCCACDDYVSVAASSGVGCGCSVVSSSSPLGPPSSSACGCSSAPGSPTASIAGGAVAGRGLAALSISNHAEEEEEGVLAPAEHVMPPAGHPARLASFAFPLHPREEAANPEVADAAVSPTMAMAPQRSALTAALRGASSAGLTEPRPQRPPAEEAMLAAAAAHGWPVPPEASRALRVARPQAHVHSVNFVPDDWEGEGLVEELRVRSATLQDPAYVDSEMYYAPGAVAKLPPAGFGALGWMVASGHSDLEAEAAMAGLMRGVVMKLSRPLWA